MFAGLPPSSSELSERKGVVPPSPPADRLREHRRWIARSARAGSRCGSRRLRRHSPTKARFPRSVFIARSAAEAGAVSRCLPRSLADERRVCSLARPGQRRASLAQPAARDRFSIARSARGGSRGGSRRLRRHSGTKERVPSFRVHCSLRSLRLALVSRCLPRSLADERRVCSLARPGQRRASLAQPAARDRFLIARSARGGSRGGSRRLRRHSGTKERVPSFLLSPAARDPRQP